MNRREFYQSTDHPSSLPSAAAHAATQCNTSRKNRISTPIAPRWVLIPAVFTILLGAALAAGQSVTTENSVPTMVKFSGAVQGAHSRIIGVTFALYKEEQGGSPLWMETQSVSLDSNGRYSVQLGATLPVGLPKDAFESGDARWLGVQPEGQAEQPRVLLLSVPYALKAADAQTLGGLPASAFMLARAPVNLSSSTGNSDQTSTSAGAGDVPPPAAANVTTNGGTVNVLPLFTTASNIQNSGVAQTGSGATVKIGVNTTAPTATLDVNGTANIRGILSLPAKGTATATAGKTSQPETFTASVFGSGTTSAVNQKFQWQAEPVGNNTANPTATLNLLFGSGTASPIETGLSLNNKGLLKFAQGQTFPGTGTLTGLTAGTGLSGGGTSGNVTLSLNTGFADGRYAQLGANNTFSGTQIVNNSIGIGIATPAYPLHVNGVIRAENGLSIGGTAFLLVDAPGIIGGHLAVLGNGRVGINNANPSTALDVVGNISSSGTLIGGSLSVSGGGVINGGLATTAGITTGAGVTVGGQLTTNAGLKINGDITMNAAPHMFITGNLPGPLFAGQPAAFFLPDRNITITRFSMYVNVPVLCSPAGTVSIVNSGNNTDLKDLNITGPYNDLSGLSIPIAAGAQISVFVTTAPNCGIQPATRDGAVSIQYVMN